MAERNPPPSHDPIARLRRLLRRTNHVAALAAGAAMCAMMFVGTLDVLGTNLLGAPLPAAREAIATLVVAAVFLSLPLAQEQGAHIRVEVIADRLLPAAWQRRATILQTLATAVFFALIAVYGWLAAWRSLTTGEYAAGLINWPIAPARAILALGASLLVLQALLDLIQSARTKRTP